jgi:hypothetical protein
MKIPQLLTAILLLALTVSQPASAVSILYRFAATMTTTELDGNETPCEGCWIRGTVLFNRDANIHLRQGSRIEYDYAVLGLTLEAWDGTDIREFYTYGDTLLTTDVADGRESIFLAAGPLRVRTERDAWPGFRDLQLRRVLSFRDWARFDEATAFFIIPGSGRHFGPLDYFRRARDQPPNDVPEPATAWLLGLGLLGLLLGRRLRAAR